MWYTLYEVLEPLDPRRGGPDSVFLDEGKYGVLVALFAQRVDADVTGEGVEV